MVTVASAAIIVGGAAAPTSAARGGTGHTVSITTHQHGTWVEKGDTDFCTGEKVTPTITGNAVFHVTYFPDGDEVWGTFTETGKASFTQPSSGLQFSGRVTFWGNFNVNERNKNRTFTASFKFSAVDSNGVVHYEVGHQVFHVSWNAVDQKPVVRFGKVWMTCT